MSPLRRAARCILVAVLLAGAGAVGGLALHWYVVQPTDAELIAMARGIDIDGLVTSGEPVVSGRWAPSFDRGGVLVGAASGAEVSGAGVAATLEAQGWEVHDVSVRTSSQTVHASRGGVDVDVHMREGEAAATEATVWLSRGDGAPSLTTTVVLGAVVGALGGLALGRRRAR